MSSLSGADAEYARLLDRAKLTKGTGLDGARLAQLAHQRQRYQATKAYVPVPSMVDGTGETATVNLGVANDVSYNVSIQVAAGALPAFWPISAFGRMTVKNNVWAARTSNDLATVTTYSFMYDGDRFRFFTAAGGLKAEIFVDRKPLAGNPYSLGNTTGFGSFGYQEVIFGSAKPRLIEIRTVAGLTGIYGKTPYTFWEAPLDTNPSLVGVGDSWIYPSIMNDASAGFVTPDAWLEGFLQRAAAPLGLRRLTSDGIGGSGFLRGTKYGAQSRLDWLKELNPDVVYVQQSGNDIYHGKTTSEMVSEAVFYYSKVREILPKAKLMWGDGFTPAGWSTYGASYLAVRDEVKAQLTARSIDVYYLDFLTNRPLKGTGYVTAANTSGNNDIYSGSDTFHLTTKGNAFIRSVIVPKIARVLADDGSLLNQTI